MLKKTPLKPKKFYSLRKTKTLNKVNDDFVANNKTLILEKVYGKFKVLSFDHFDAKKGNIYQVECINCGKKYTLPIDYIKSTRIKCCDIEKSYSRTKLFNIWAEIKQQSITQNILICDEWKDFKNFRKWAENNSYRDSLTVVRNDITLGYSPENCTLANIQLSFLDKKEEFKILSDNLSNNLQKKNWKSIRQYALVLFSKLVRARAGFKCELCGKAGMDAHHWYYTKAHNTVTDIMSINGICLCRSCHSKAHSNISEYKERIQQLNRYKGSVSLLESIVNSPVDFGYVKEIILANKKELSEIYKKSKLGYDFIVEELLKSNI